MLLPAAAAAVSSELEVPEVQTTINQQAFWQHSAFQLGYDFGATLAFSVNETS